jgi:methionyl-tRNA synthetase
MADAKLYLTTPIYYVNGDPHIGHAHTSVMGDILKRVGLMRGADTLLSTGTDEHGQKNQEAAEASGLSAEEYLARQSGRFRALFDRLDVAYDMWVRTTSAAHKVAVQEVVRRMHERGCLVKKEYSGLYCVGCEQFKRKSDLDEEGRCPDHLVKPLEMTEENYFLTIERFRPWLLAEIERRPDWIRPAVFRGEVLKMLDRPLDDLCISRPKTRVRLGIDVPFDKDYVVYVWFDALINYITNIGWPTDLALTDKWWPSSTHLMAKDIIKTHCIYWPIMLKAIDMAPPDRYRVHGFWVGEGGVKMSKSIGNVVEPDDLIKLVGSDGLRYYLAKAMKATDTPISAKLVAATYNADLANGLGNMYSRAVKFTRKHFGGHAPAPATLTPTDDALCREVAAVAQDALDRLDLETIPAMAQAIATVAGRLNTYFEELAPWELAKRPDARGKLESGLYAVLDCLRLAFELAAPIMPRAAKRALANLGAQPIPATPAAHRFTAGALPKSAPLGEDSNLFPRVEV